MKSEYAGFMVIFSCLGFLGLIIAIAGNLIAGILYGVIFCALYWRLLGKFENEKP